MTRQQSFFSLGAIALFAGAGLAHASTLTITESITGSGSLGGVSFTNAPILFTVTADTGNVVTMPPLESVVSAATTLQEGAFSASFTGQYSAYVYQSGTSSQAGFGSGSAIAGGNVVLSLVNPNFATFNLASAIGPLVGAPSINPGFSFSTSSGAFILNSVTGNATYTARLAATPEPAASLLVSIGLLGLGIAGKRFRRAL